MQYLCFIKSSNTRFCQCETRSAINHLRIKDKLSICLAQKDRNFMEVLILKCIIALPWYNIHYPPGGRGKPIDPEHVAFEIAYFSGKKLYRLNLTSSLSTHASESLEKIIKFG